MLRPLSAHRRASVAQRAAANPRATPPGSAHRRRTGTFLKLLLTIRARLLLSAASFASMISGTALRADVAHDDLERFARPFQIADPVGRIVQLINPIAFSNFTSRVPAFVVSTGVSHFGFLCVTVRRAHRLLKRLGMASFAVYALRGSCCHLSERRQASRAYVFRGSMLRLGRWCRSRTLLRASRIWRVRTAVRLRH